jgi:hypothetical protein
MRGSSHGTIKSNYFLAKRSQKKPSSHPQNPKSRHFYPFFAKSVIKTGGAMRVRPTNGLFVDQIIPRLKPKPSRRPDEVFAGFILEPNQTKMH